MKKIFSVLLAACSFTIANAQYHNDRNDNRNSTYARNDDRRFNDAYSFTARERDEQIARINSMYDSQIRAINVDRYLNARKKRKEIQKVELDRSQKIREVNAKFADRRNRFNDTYVYSGSRR